MKKQTLLLLLFVLASPCWGQSDQIIQLWESGQKKEARVQLKKWLAQDKKSPEALTTSAQIQFLKKKYRSCLKICKKVLKKTPSYAAAFYWRGRSYEAMENPLEAANEYRAALQAQNDFTEAQEGLNRVQSILEAPSFGALIETEE